MAGKVYENLFSINETKLILAPPPPPGEVGGI